MADTSVDSGNSRFQQHRIDEFLSNNKFYLGLSNSLNHIQNFRKVVKVPNSISNTSLKDAVTDNREPPKRTSFMKISPSMKALEVELSRKNRSMPMLPVDSIQEADENDDVPPKSSSVDHLPESNDNSQLYSSAMDKTFNRWTQSNFSPFQDRYSKAFSYVTADEGYGTDESTPSVPGPLISEEGEPRYDSLPVKPDDSFIEDDTDKTLNSTNPTDDGLKNTNAFNEQAPTALEKSNDNSKKSSLSNTYSKPSPRSMIPAPTNREVLEEKKTTRGPAKRKVPSPMGNYEGPSLQSGARTSGVEKERQKPKNSEPKRNESVTKQEKIDGKGKPKGKRGSKIFSFKNLFKLKDSTNRKAQKKPNVKSQSTYDLSSFNKASLSENKFADGRKSSQDNGLSKGKEGSKKPTLTASQSFLGVFRHKKNASTSELESVRSTDAYNNKGNPVNTETLPGNRKKDMPMKNSEENSSKPFSKQNEMKPRASEKEEKGALKLEEEMPNKDKPVLNSVSDNAENGDTSSLQPSPFLLNQDIPLKTSSKVANSNNNPTPHASQKGEVVDLTKASPGKKRNSKSSLERRSLLGESLFPKHLDLKEVESIVSLERTLSMKSKMSANSKMESPSPQVEKDFLPSPASFGLHSPTTSSPKGSQTASIPQLESVEEDVIGDTTMENLIDFIEFKDYIDVENLDFSLSPQDVAISPRKESSHNSSTFESSDNLQDIVFFEDNSEDKFLDFANEQSGAKGPVQLTDSKLDNRAILQKNDDVKELQELTEHQYAKTANANTQEVDNKQRLPGYYGAGDVNVNLQKDENGQEVSGYYDPQDHTSILHMNEEAQGKPAYVTSAIQDFSSNSHGETGNSHERKSSDDQTIVPESPHRLASFRPDVSVSSHSRAASGVTSRSNSSLVSIEESSVEEQDSNSSISKLEGEVSTRNADPTMLTDYNSARIGNKRPISMSFKGMHVPSFGEKIKHQNLRTSESHQSFNLSFGESEEDSYTEMGLEVAPGFGSDEENEIESIGETSGYYGQFDDNLYEYHKGPSNLEISKFANKKNQNPNYFNPALDIPNFIPDKIPMVSSTESSPKTDSRSNFENTPSVLLHSQFASSPKVGDGGVRFSSRIILYDTYDNDEYDRHPDTATCNQLTPILAQQIKEELNSLKSDMEIHMESRKFTHFF